MTQLLTPKVKNTVVQTANIQYKLAKLPLTIGYFFMPLAIAYSRASIGITAPLVTVEVHLSNGLPSLSIVGLPEAAIKESKDRVRSALLNSEFEFPSRRITINLAPADLRKKEGGRFDLPIAIGILAASLQIPPQILADYEFGGELALDGTLRPFIGALPFAMGARLSKRKLIVPLENADEAALPENITVIPAKHLLEVIAHLLGTKTINQHVFSKTSTTPSNNLPDISEICGQEHAKRALEIAAAGEHSLLMIGPPGTGKTMLANRLLSILPKMNDEEALETAAINSICGKNFNFNEWRLRPFRSPHHTTSSVALVGGSSPPRPGEISLSHNGVLFLDELPEFNRSVLESLREPMESGHVTISRAAHQAQFPAKFQLIAAMNPCPCGYFGDNQKDCNCSPDQIARYQGRISGPLLDRIDIHLEVPKLPEHLLVNSEQNKSETSEIIRAKVLVARNRAISRANKVNSAIQGKEFEKYCFLAPKLREYLLVSMQKLNFSTRSYHKILKISRTIADLENSETIDLSHLQEAMSYRKKLAIKH